MHNFEQIKKNQKEFHDEIVSYLKKDIKEAKEDLTNIKAKDESIKRMKESLQRKVNKFKLIPELEKYFITEKNQNPKFYAFWDEELKEVQIFKYIYEERA
jgi:hypothetical protein